MPDEVNNDMRPKGTLPGDAILRHILGLVHYELLHPEITIAVNGLLVTGKAISEVEYLGEFVGRNKATYGPLISQVTESLVRRYRLRCSEIDEVRIAERWDVDAQYDIDDLDKVDELVDQVAGNIEHVYLRDARFFTTGNSSPVSVNLWRCRLDAVDGFSIDETGAPPLE